MQPLDPVQNLVVQARRSAKTLEIEINNDQSNGTANGVVIDSRPVHGSEDDDKEVEEGDMEDENISCPLGGEDNLHPGLNGT